MIARENCQFLFGLSQALSRSCVPTGFVTRIQSIADSQNLAFYCNVLTDRGKLQKGVVNKANGCRICDPCRPTCLFVVCGLSLLTGLICCLV